MKNKLFTFLTLALLTLNFQLSSCFAQGTAFTYQGRLTAGTNSANGSYDLSFALFQYDTGGNVILGPITNLAVIVSNGLFTSQLDFGPFDLDAYSRGRWLEISVRTNGFGPLVVLNPRQPMTPAPSAIYAAYASNPAPGSGFNADLLDGLDSAALWKIAGNAGTTAGTHFLGTTDNQPLELKVNGRRASRLEPGLEDANHSDVPNVIGGSSLNSVGGGIVGATIGGGGANNYFGSGGGNSVSGDFGTVGGGLNNLSSGLGTTVGGGLFNSSSVWAATVGGGWFNTSSGTNATVAGGYNNTSSGYSAVVGGGYNNTSSGYNAAVGGGEQNISSLEWATVAGGYQNKSTNVMATVSGGGYNIGSGSASTVGGGVGNQATDYTATVPGGYYNVAGGQYSFAAGQFAKALHYGTFVWADYTTGDFTSTAGNQFLIRASGGVGVGVNAPQQKLSVAAGLNIDQNNANSGTVSNGLTFGSGSGEGIASKRTAGGNQYGLDFYSNFARRMSIRNNGNIGIGTDTPAEKLHVIGNFIRVDGAANEQVYIGGDGGGNDAQFGSLNSGVTDVVMWNPTRGECMNVNAKAFNLCSDRNLKDVAGDIRVDDVLNKVLALPLQRWSFKGESDIQHVGPMAQDFRAAFGLGKDDKHIATVDADGVALAAIQGLNRKLTEELQRRDADNAELKQRLEKLERLLNHKLNGGAK